MTARKPLKPTSLGNNPERISVRLRADQIHAIRKLAGPPPWRPGESEVIRRLIDAGLKARR